MFQIGLKKFLWLKKLKTLFRRLILAGEEIAGTYYEKEFQKTNQKEFRVKKKSDKRKGDKLYVKWKGYNKSFNSWIDKKHMV